MGVSLPNGNPRAELLRALAPFNQIRNALYYLIHFMEKQQLDAVEELTPYGAGDC